MNNPKQDPIKYTYCTYLPVLFKSWSNPGQKPPGCWPRVTKDVKTSYKHILPFTCVSGSVNNNQKGNCWRREFGDPPRKLGGRQTPAWQGSKSGLAEAVSKLSSGNNACASLGALFMHLSVTFSEWFAVGHSSLGWGTQRESAKELWKVKCHELNDCPHTVVFFWIPFVFTSCYDTHTHSCT